MPAQSKAQQRFMGMVHAAQKGELDNPSKEVEKVAKDMDKSDAKDFASTKHKGLPNHVKQEILKRVKEYAIVGDKDVKYPANNEPLRSDDEMDLQEDRIPQNFNVGVASDYHTKVGTTPRKDYDDTNFDKENAGQPDLEEGTGDELEMLKLTVKAMKSMPGSPRQKQYIKQLNALRVKNGLKPLAETYIKEWGSSLDNYYILNKDAKLDGTPEDIDAIDRTIESANEEQPHQKEMIDGIVEMLNQVEDINNRKEMALDQLNNFKKEGIEVNTQEFLNRCGLSSVNEVGIKDWHFKAIEQMYKKAGSFTRKKIAALITKNPNSSWDKIERELKDSDYGDVSYYTDRLHLEGINESWTVKDGNVLSNGKLIGYYDFDRDSDSFWVDDVKKGKGQISFDTKKEVEDYFKKNEKDAVKHLQKIREGKELKWQDVEVGDAANVKAINKTGLIIKTYGRKFHLKFPNGSTKTYDANELTFVKNESVNESTNPREEALIKTFKNIVDNHSSLKVKDGGRTTLVDVQSANAVLKLYDALSDSNKKTLLKMSIPKMIKMAWHVLGKK